MKANPENPDLNRRDFLRGSSFASLMLMLGAVELRAEEKPKTDDANAKSKGAKVKCGVIGCGKWGREILNKLASLPAAEVAGVCETYEPFLRRAQEAAPKAEAFTDYRKLLEKKEIIAVAVATPSHQHKEIVLAALQAGKHVFCEAPLATTIDDARAIARAAQAAPSQLFQTSLPMRSDPQRHFLLQFIRSGALGKSLKSRSQWHKKTSWRFTSANPDREKEINWRLSAANSLGLIGEIGIHQVDAAAWFLRARPVAVTGYGSILQWPDGRDVADTIHAVFEFPGGVNFTYDCTLGNSFDADYDMIYGSDAAVLLRENKAWMFKEVDAPLLGWEIYARKDTFYRETGIALVANATKLVAQGDKSAEEAPYASTALGYALEAFVANTDMINTAVEDFKENFNASDKKAMQNYIAGLSKNLLPAAGYKEGYEAAVTVIKASEAIQKNQKITFLPEWFEIG
ncbi:MAG: Gfo/Idh/MocA family oxidoreductase [Verrucomicrobia bacterium]|nr:Gfo/Idh/MocA family oxidoreductase [Verrucomicrobiota bacterium]